MKLIKAIALAFVLLASMRSYAGNGFTLNAYNGSTCTYPTSVVFSMGTWWYYGVTTNGVPQYLSKSGDNAFWYGLNCQLGYAKNQTMYFEMKGTNIFGSLNHAGVLMKSTASENPAMYHAEGPIFWGTPITTVPRVQIERFAHNVAPKTQHTGPASVSTTDYPRGTPTFVDGVTYRVWVDANLNGVQIWVLDPSSNTGDRSTWIANFVQSWAPNESVNPMNFGIGFFAIPQGSAIFPYGAQLEFSNIQVTN